MYLFFSANHYWIKSERNRVRINNLTSKENVNFLKDKIRQIKNGLEKENYLNKEDAKLLNDFINKIKSELIAK